MERESWRNVWALVLLIILLQSEVTHGANILALFPFASKSHNNIYSAITRALAQKGHQFTVVTSQPIDSPPPNYRQINVYDIVESRYSVFNTTRKIGMVELFGELNGLNEDICGTMMRREEVKALAKPSVGIKFDLILMSAFFSECLYPFARNHNAPVVLISPNGPMPTTYGAVGNVISPAFLATPMLGYSDRMNFKERILNTLAYFGFQMFYKVYLQSNMESYMRISFGEDTPSISELEEYVSLIVMNNHFSLDQARPLVPCLIEAGGLHVKPPKELPKDLKTFLDGAGEDGVIYFSLGSILKSSGLAKETKDGLVAAFSKVKQRILWKWEGENPIPGQSNNVRLEKWLPQQDVLAHPNIKLFITHGGLLSFQEAVSRGVPLVGIPHFGDQEMNMERVVREKLGVKIDPQNLTETSILYAVKEVLENPTYSTNMKRMQTIMMDQKDDPLERAVYWIEYVIRHKGAKHLKPAAFYLKWYQVYMLDVLFVLIVIPTLVNFGIGLVCYKLIKKWLCRRKSSSGRKTKTSKKKTQ